MNINEDYEHMLFYFAYKTFISAADEIIEQFGMQRQHHRFLFFICKKPGITVKELLTVLEISKQGSQSTLKVLKEKALITERYAPQDKRLKELYPTEKGIALIDKLNKAQRNLFEKTFNDAGDNWFAVMEALAGKRPGFSLINEEEV
ncbi:MarR family winged helix-turn-helix transcriptional regulator [Macrococcoides canis]|uniref:MarR family winged helix-turn-helix transcriptional regulator n=1 Tax=Macrococcoides canis TaxID=1855823 RepID=UPI0013E955FB|nr:helix-turn-helix domain-containing protein [Macrococcus canis]QIH76265.1 MarR family transcriptional regulator [Macrococcus canis]QTQ07382.1 MarR family transcriptional regulator [Macrococcus canis]QUR95308.1 MarR family transcriptional regulator [Macrococcus canis]UTH01686.1 MarR family transcriptional regulator [Macrococcus canis]UTH06145.1 MarR family transcriptional regulator [Macrococcus canis]